MDEVRFEPLGESLPEPEIYTRLLEKMGVLPTRFPLLERIARREPKATAHLGYVAALAATLASNKKLMPFAASLLYRTLGQALPSGAAVAAPLLPLCIQFASKHPEAVRRAGFRGNKLTLGTALFRGILEKREGTLMSMHRIEDMWTLMGTPDRKVRLEIPEMLAELRALETETPPGADFPFILAAGGRRSYNANQIYRDPAWRKVDPHGALRLHPDDAATLQVSDGETVVCASARDSINVVVEIDDSVRRGMVTLPHGYGQRYQGGPAIGPELNRLTSGTHCDPLSRTPYHKYVPVHIRKHAAAATGTTTTSQEIPA